MSLDLTRPDEVSERFLALCERLRRMGALKVEAFGCVACFSPRVDPGLQLVAPPEPEPEAPLGEEAKVLQARARHLAQGGGGY